MASTCENHILAQNAVARVERCAECGSISVHIGPLTLRLDEAALSALWPVLAEADARLETRRTKGAGLAPRPREWA